MSTDNTAPTPSPFATPAQAPTPPAPAPSPFAAPAQAAPAPTTPQTTDYGDTSFLDETPTREPLIKSCVVPGIVRITEPKENPENGKQSVFVAVQLYGEKMVFENGDPVSPGKRLVSTFYAPIDTPEKRERTETKLKNLLLALNDVPLTLAKTEMAIYKAWPPEKKIGYLLPGEKHPELKTPKLTLHAFLPTNRWDGTKVLVKVSGGKDMDGNPRNEFTLFAASTPVTERKGRS